MKNVKWTKLMALSLALLMPLIALGETPFGAAALSEGKTYTVEEMLTYAIQDEYLARAEYKVIMDAYGEQRPFINIMKAEGGHIELLLPLFTAYQITVPEDTVASLMAALPELPLAKTLRYCREFGLPLHTAALLAGDAGRAAFFETAAAVLPPGRYYLFNRLELMQWAALMSRCRVLVSMDTGAVHLAAAVRTPGRSPAKPSESPPESRKLRQTGALKPRKT